MITLQRKIELLTKHLEATEGVALFASKSELPKECLQLVYNALFDVSHLSKEEKRWLLKQCRDSQQKENK